MLPRFIMMIGLPASGKTSYAEMLAKNSTKLTTILSSDAIRKELYGDENVQQDPEKVFATMLRRTKEALKAGVDVIFDATNIRRKHRVNILSQLPPCSKLAFVVWKRYEECVEEDKKRERSVGESTIKRMLLNFEFPYWDETWDWIEIIHNSKLYNNGECIEMLDVAHDNPHHNNSVLTHSANVMKLLIGCRKNLDGDLPLDNPAEVEDVLYNAAFFHDIGKKFTKRFKDVRGNDTEDAHFYNHHNVSAYIATGSSNIMSVQSRGEKYLSIWLVNHHMDPFLETRYYKKLPKDLKYLLDFFSKYDKEGA